MIKPSELPSIPQDNHTDRAAIECHIDEAIRRHYKAAAAWPLFIQDTRAGWNQLDIDAVLALYRSAGWSATPGINGTMVVLSPLDNTTTAQPAPAGAGEAMAPAATPRGGDIKIALPKFPR